MAHVQKPDLVFEQNGRVHLNRRGCQFSRLLAVKERGSADSNCIDRVPTYSARLLATHSIRIFPLHFPCRVSPCAIRFRTRYTTIMYSSSESETSCSFHNCSLWQFTTYWTSCLSTCSMPCPSIIYFPHLFSSCSCSQRPVLLCGPHLGSGGQ